MIRGGAILVAAAVCVLAVPAGAQSQNARRVTVAPYVEVGQVLNADLNGGDVLTYTSAAVGVDAVVSTARVSGQASYRYERRFGWNKDIGDDDIHNGLARVAVKLAPALVLEAGGLATRARTDIRGAAPTPIDARATNLSQVVSVYGGPSYARQVGAVALAADYRIGYTQVGTPNGGSVAPGVPRLDYYSDSLSQQATARAALAPNTVLPVGLSASGGYAREDAGQLDALYEGANLRGDALMPISATVALTAGAGYERIETSQRSPLVTAAGLVVLDTSGRFVTDPASPRRIAYRTDGLYYDAGVVWRPNRRTSLAARAGKRYGTASFTGSASYQSPRGLGLRIDVYDGIQTFGQQLRQSLQALPTNFVPTTNVAGQQFNGCVFGVAGDAPGGCLSNVFQSITTASYRSRGVNGVLVMQRGRSTFGAGAGYSRRKLFAPNATPGIVTTGADDESWYGQVSYARALNAVSGINANALANYYHSELRGADDVLSVGGTLSYYHVFGRLQTTATAGVYRADAGRGTATGLAAALSAQALLSARYTF